MTQPDRARARFEAYVSGPPQSTANLKARVQQAQGAADPAAQPLVRASTLLLDHIARKTTPLHVRLIHAAALTVLDRVGEAGASVDGERAVLAYVVGRVRRPDITF